MTEENHARRKLLLGAYVIDAMWRDSATRADWLERLDAWLSNPADRALFGLDQESQHEAAPEPNAAQWGDGVAAVIAQREQIDAWQTAGRSLKAYYLEHQDRLPMTYEHFVRTNRRTRQETESACPPTSM